MGADAITNKYLGEQCPRNKLVYFSRGGPGERIPITQGRRHPPSLIRKQASFFTSIKSAMPDLDWDLDRGVDV